MSGFLNNMFGPLATSSVELLLLLYLCEKQGVPRRLGWLGALLLNGGIHLALGLFFERIGYAIYPVLATPICFVMLMLWGRLYTDVGFYGRCFGVVLVLLFSNVLSNSAVHLYAAAFGYNFFDAGPLAARLGMCLALLGLKLGLMARIKGLAAPMLRESISGTGMLLTLCFVLPYAMMRDYYRIWGRDMPFDWFYFALMFFTGSCGVLGMLVGGRMLHHQHVNENLRMDRLVHKQHEQYVALQGAIARVNENYHDMKHILKAIESMESLEEVRAYVKGAHGGMEDYALLSHTGNLTLDIILSDKLRECRDKGIALTTHVDGRDWDALRRTDIAAIFGNALDNAVESAERCRDPAKRYIAVRASHVKGMLVTSFENGFEHSLLPGEGGGFLSGKRGGGEHGYGLRSIGRTARDLGGEINIRARDGRFVLTVILPREANPAPESANPAPGPL